MQHGIPTMGDVVGTLTNALSQITGMTPTFVTEVTMGILAPVDIALVE